MDCDRPYWSPGKTGSSIGGKSASSLSKCSSLSVDVSKEMAAVSRDIDKVIRRGQTPQEFGRRVKSSGQDGGRPTTRSSQRIRKPKEKRSHRTACLDSRQLSNLIEETKTMVNKVYKSMLAAQQRPWVICRSCSFSRASCQSSCGRQGFCRGGLSRWRECRHPPGHFHDTTCILDAPPCPVSCHKSLKEKGVNVSPSVHRRSEKIVVSCRQPSPTSGTVGVKRDACCSPVREIISASEIDLDVTVDQLKERIAAVVSMPQRRLETSSPLLNRQQGDTQSPRERFRISPVEDCFDNSYSFSEDGYHKKNLPLDRSPDSAFSVNNDAECLAGRRNNFLQRPIPLEQSRTGGGDEGRRAVVWQILSGIIFHKEMNEQNGLVDDSLSYEVMKRITQILIANTDSCDKYNGDWKYQEMRRRHLNNIQAELSLLEELESS